MALSEFDYRFTERRKRSQNDVRPAKPASELNGAEADVMWCLFKHGPTWDGDLPSKSGRSELVEKGYVERADGWNLLTASGVLLALDRGLGLRKGTR